MNAKSFALLVVCLLAATAAYSAIDWRMQPQRSELTFVGTQAGAQFEGRFTRFTADIRFDPQRLADSHFDVTIDTASVDTRDAERDEVLKGPDLLAVERYPSARYVAERFTSNGKGRYAATGQLTLRGVTKPVPIQFSFEESASGAWLKGTATLERLDFGVGQGDWKDTQWVANEIQVEFALLLTRP